MTFELDVLLHLIKICISTMLPQIEKVTFNDLCVFIMLTFIPNFNKIIYQTNKLSKKKWIFK